MVWLGIFFKKHDVTITKRRDMIPGRLLLIDCLYLGHKFRLINVYTASERTKKMLFLKKLREIVNVGFSLILCGDFNTVTADQDRIAATSFQIAREGKLLVEVCKGASLSDLYRGLNPKTIHFTHFYGKTKTRIDRIYQRKGSLQQIVVFLHLFHKPLIPDHFIRLSI
uniref:Endonuclease/exonuclease/phosphatase domain-containing protein n=1 Tax=Mola mola TaxID=94237 RepID=A0A3Q4B746_MOLML